MAGEPNGDLRCDVEAYDGLDAGLDLVKIRVPGPLVRLLAGRCPSMLGSLVCVGIVAWRSQRGDLLGTVATTIAAVVAIIAMCWCNAKIERHAREGPPDP